MPTQWKRVSITMRPEVDTKLERLKAYHNNYNISSLIAYCVAVATREMEAEQQAAMLKINPTKNISFRPGQ